MNIHFFELKEWNENSLGISKLIMSPSYRKFDRGDIYFRFNGNKIHCKQFTGESNNFYDQDFGAGEENHRAKTIDVNDLIVWLYHNSYSMYEKLIKKLIDRGFNIELWEQNNNVAQPQENYNIA